MGRNSPVAQVFGGPSAGQASNVFNEVRGVIEKNQAPAADPTDPPKIEDARQTAFQDERKDLKRRRATSTIFGGTASSLDAPLTASNTLLGY